MVHFLLDSVKPYHLSGHGLPQTEFTMHLFSKHTTPSLEGYSQERKCMEADLKLSKLPTVKIRAPRGGKKRKLSSKVDYFLEQT